MSREAWVNGCLAGLLLLVPLTAHWFDEPFIVTLATRVAILALAAVGLNIALGYGGLVSFGHAAFFGVGAYVTGILASHALNSEPMMLAWLALPGTTQMLIHWPVAMLLCALLALGIGALSLRTSGVYFIMITLAFAQMLYYFAVSWPAYGGDDGLSIYLRSSFPGINTVRPLGFFVITFGVLILALLLSARVSGSAFGLALHGARQNPQRVRSLGIDPRRVQLVAFVISAMITGLAGCLYADLNRFVSPSMLGWNLSGEFIVFILLGGLGRHLGPLAGAALFVVFEAVFGAVTDHWSFFLGLLLLFVVLFARGGLLGWLAGERAHV